MVDIRVMRKRKLKNLCDLSGSLRLCEEFATQSPWTERREQRESASDPENRSFTNEKNKLDLPHHIE